ncbi:hypothetical protein TRL7639_04520 [Falsiruegeria litorea R37]|uniref:Group 4 capsule polysaccharide lipoprotein gfcB, YjbF n=1 Tax=Falsiruegeria litorea R37 TaxID=1200284 RepID=A0A1Y5TW11_9RHOB|nr:YjbF family lipoprotein [Falsiruegeria litorea]SLN74268.1 hypothetical protein TRL7639_04520 [Falsiruegeria litorea R37]
MVRWMRAAGLLLGGLVLVGCAEGPEPAPLQVEIYRAGQQAIAKRTQARDTGAQPAPTRAFLDSLDVPVQEMIVERSNVVAYVIKHFETRDNLPGQVQVWRTTDDFAVAMRNGVLISTRGFWGDLLSSSVQVSGSEPGPSHEGEHIQMILARDNREVPFAFGCELTDLGQETIEIVERRHTTQHIRQSCEGRKGAITNDYWVDKRRGVVMQSRQWAGPNIGYLRFRRLTD